MSGEGMKYDMHVGREVDTMCASQEVGLGGVTMRVVLAVWPVRGCCVKVVSWSKSSCALVRGCVASRRVVVKVWMAGVILVSVRFHRTVSANASTGGYGGGY